MYFFSSRDLQELAEKPEGIKARDAFWQLDALERQAITKLMEALIERKAVQDTR